MVLAGQAHVLEKFRCANHSKAGVIPPSQRFAADNFAGQNVDLRLEPWPNVPRLDRVHQPLHEHDAPLRMRVIFKSVPRGASTLSLGAIHSNVCVTQ